MCRKDGCLPKLTLKAYRNGTDAEAAVMILSMPLTMLCYCEILGMPTLYLFAFCLCVFEGLVAVL